MEKYGNEAPPEVAFLTSQEAWGYGYSMGYKQGRADAFIAAKDMIDDLFPQRVLAPEVSDDEG